MWHILGCVVLAVVVFLLWRITSVGRGARQRDEKVVAALEPVGRRLADGVEVAPSEVEELCRRPELRPMLYGILKHLDRLELFPEECASWERQAEGLLAYWMMHPNELDAAPAQIECLKRIEREIGGKTATFIVLRYKMPPGHWAGDQWLLGLSGPFLEGEAPYSGLAGGFSRAGDTEETAGPEELVDWYVGMCRAKGLAWA